MDFKQEMKLKNHIKSKLYKNKKLTKQEAIQYLFNDRRHDYDYHINKPMFAGERLYLACDRDSSYGSYSYPSCFHHDADKLVVVYYSDEDSFYDVDILLLCDSCFQQMKNKFDDYSVFTLTASDKNKIYKKTGSDKPVNFFGRL